MSTVVVELTNPKAINLLRDLESMQIIRLLHSEDTPIMQPQTEPESDRLAGKASTQTAKERLLELLLSGPVMTDEEMTAYQQNKDWMNQWKVE